MTDEKSESMPENLGAWNYKYITPRRARGGFNVRLPRDKIVYCRTLEDAKKKVVEVYGKLERKTGSPRSRYRGVCWNKDRKNWYIIVDGKRRFFKTEQEAIKEQARQLGRDVPLLRGLLRK